VGWAALGLFCFYIFAGVYSALVGISEDQTTLDDLGANESALMMAISAVLVVVVAPVVEEIFFRGFFYRALRTSLPIWGAALITGTIFGAIHVFTGAQAVPILIVLGVILCLVYEHTGTLYSVIGLHAFNNAIAFSVTTEEVAMAMPLGAAVIAACAILPRFTARDAPLLT
jgi:CAAX protease family protein